MDIDDIVAMSGVDYDNEDGMGAFPALPKDFTQLMQRFQGKRAARPMPRPAIIAPPRYAPAPPQYAPPQYAPPQYAPPQYQAPTPQVAQLQQMFHSAALNPGGRGREGGRIEQMGGAPSSFTFTPASAQTVTVVMAPFKPAKPTRLMVSVNIVGAPGCDVLLTTASVGDRNQLAGPGGVSVQSYSPVATGARLNWDIIQPSVPLQLVFSTTAIPAAATSITIAPTLYVVTLN